MNKCDKFKGKNEPEWLQPDGQREISLDGARV